MPDYIDERIRKVKEKITLIRRMGKAIEDSKK